MASINVDVDIDIEDYLDEVSTEDLIEELESRGKTLSSNYNDAETYITAIIGRPVFTATDEEVCQAILKAIGRYGYIEKLYY